MEIEEVINAVVYLVTISRLTTLQTILNDEILCAFINILEPFVVTLFSSQHCGTEILFRFFGWLIENVFVRRGKSSRHFSLCGESG